MRADRRTALQLPAGLTCAAVTTIALALVVTAMSLFIGSPAHAQDGDGGYGFDDDASGYDGALGWFTGEFYFDNGSIEGSTGCTAGSAGCFQVGMPDFDWMDSFYPGETWVSDGDGLTIIYDDDGNALHACSGMACSPILGDPLAADDEPPPGSFGCTDIYDADGNYVETVGPGPYSTTTAPQWWNDSGTWWGTKTYEYNLCGILVNVDPGLICTIQQCVDETFAPAIDQAETTIESRVPDLQTNPTSTGIVHVETWFWDAGPWLTETFTNTHGSAPVSVVVTATPRGLAIRTGDGTSIACVGPGQPWTDGVTATDCGHTYLRPSLGTGPGGADVYQVEAARLYAVTCFATAAGSGGGFSMPFPCNTERLSEFAFSSYPVQEMQSVNR